MAGPTPLVPVRRPAWHALWLRADPESKGAAKWAKKLDELRGELGLGDGKPAAEKSPAAKPKKRPLTMIVKSLAQHISPSRMLVEFPTAFTAEAHFDTRTNERTALVLTFDAAHPPASRESTHFGCKLQPVVTPPEGAESTRRVVWYRKDGTVRQHTRAAADATVGI